MRGQYFHPILVSMNSSVGSFPFYSALRSPDHHFQRGFDNRLVPYKLDQPRVSLRYEPVLRATLLQNAGSVRTRTVASSVYNMAVQAGSLIASNIYQPSQSIPSRIPDTKKLSR